MRRRLNESSMGDVCSLDLFPLAEVALLSIKFGVRKVNAESMLMSMEGADSSPQTGQVEWSLFERPSRCLLVNPQRSP
jgi:hypothetical protein